MRPLNVRTIFEQVNGLFGKLILVTLPLYCLMHTSALAQTGEGIQQPELVVPAIDPPTGLVFSTRRPLDGRH